MNILRNPATFPSDRVLPPTPPPPEPPTPPSGMGCAIPTTTHPRWDEHPWHYGIDLLNFKMLPSGKAFVTIIANKLPYDDIGQFGTIMGFEDANSLAVMSMNHSGSRVYINSYRYGTSLDTYSGNATRLVRSTYPSESSLADGAIIPNAYIGNNSIVYSGVKIGLYVFLSQNLSETKYANNDDIAILNTRWTSSDKEFPRCATTLAGIYGCLYNFAALDDFRGIVNSSYPDWQVVTSLSLFYLVNYVQTTYGYTSQNTARALKSCRQVNHPLA